MNRLPLSVPSRRDFLKDVVIVSAATAGGLGLVVPSATAATPPSAAPAATPTSVAPADHIQKIALSVKPSLSANGAVVVPTKHLTFLIFPAVSTAGQGAGRAVIELKGCVQKRFTYTSATSKLPAVDDLELCDIFEVENSTWAKSLLPTAAALAPVATTTPLQPSAAAPPVLRHFIFTFVETNFGCVANELRVELRHESFRETLAYIQLRELGE